MRPLGVVVTSGVAMLVGAALLAAAPSGSSSAGGAAAGAAAARQGRVRLTKPWSEMTSLSDKEKSEILDIHRKAVEQIHEIEAKEKQDILAMLTPQQKKEVEDIEAKDKLEAKERRSRNPTTRPSRGAASATEAQ